MAENNLNPLIGIDELADYIGKPKATIYGWRVKGYGPRAIRVGRDLKYRLRDVDAWLDSQTEISVGEAR
jgi:predicted DNA-binding transcriptional regulator AlpA